MASADRLEARLKAEVVIYASATAAFKADAAKYASFVAKYREAIGGDDVDQPPHSEASLDQMIEAILDRDEAELSTSRTMRAIAA